MADTIDRFGVARGSGGASYDALIAATAMHHGASLLTRDERAVEVYERLGVDVMWVATSAQSFLRSQPVLRGRALGLPTPTVEPSTRQ